MDSILLHTTTALRLSAAGPFYVDLQQIAQKLTDEQHEQRITVGIQVDLVGIEKISTNLSDIPRVGRIIVVEGLCPQIYVGTASYC